MSSTYKILVNRVIDGDSLDIDVILGFGIVLQNRRLRLEGVDTPEVRTCDIIEKEFGMRSKSYVVKWCGDKHLGLLMKEGENYDKFGRILGQIVDSDGGNLVKDIIKTFHGVEYHGQNKDDIQKAHIENRTKVFTI